MKRKLGSLLVLLGLAGGTLFQFSGCNFLNDLFAEEEPGSAEQAGESVDDFFDLF